jgi:hypothetical protein
MEFNSEGRLPAVMKVGIRIKGLSEKRTHNGGNKNNRTISGCNETTQHTIHM